MDMYHLNNSEKYDTCVLDVNTLQKVGGIPYRFTEVETHDSDEKLYEQINNVKDDNDYDFVLFTPPKTSENHGGFVLNSDGEQLLKMKYEQLLFAKSEGKFFVHVKYWDEEKKNKTRVFQEICVYQNAITLKRPALVDGKARYGFIFTDMAFFLLTQDGKPWLRIQFEELYGLPTSELNELIG